MDTTRAAFVFAHPAHEILVAGMLQRFRPAILFLTNSDSGRDRDRETLARAGLERIGLACHATFLSTSEQESYRWALALHHAPYLKLRNQILDWLGRVRPTVLFGDAWEMSNFHHDLGRALLDSAWREYARGSLRSENYELPLVCRTTPDPRELLYQKFPEGGHEEFHLTAAEIAAKQDLIHWIGLQRLEVEQAQHLFPPIEREVYRRVPESRDYRFPPTSLMRHYDDWGRLLMRLRKYQTAITFADHFVPIVEQLPYLAKATPTARAA